MNAPEWKVRVVRDGATLLVDPKQLGRRNNKNRVRTNEEADWLKYFVPKMLREGIIEEGPVKMITPI